MEKKKLIKGLFYIGMILILTTVASKLLFHSGETLQDYAQNNPETAYADPKAENKQPSDKEDAIESEEETSPLPQTVSANDNVEAAAGIVGISPDRVTYQEDFYYEPLNEELRTFITGTSFPAGPAEIRYEDLRYVHVLHYNFEGESTEGELICNAAIAQDLVEVFYELYKAEYQIEKIRLIDEYEGDDDRSMEDNNTSCFNYRMVEGTDKLSRHAYGLAIDVNPFYNPYVRYNKDGSLHIDPKGSEPYADRSVSFPYKIDENDLCHKLFKEHGFTWGGDWNSMKDYQHFQKNTD